MFSSFTGALSSAAGFVQSSVQSILGQKPVEQKKPDVVEPEETGGKFIVIKPPRVESDRFVIVRNPTENTEALKQQQAEAEALKKQQAEAESLKKQQAEAESLKKQQAEAESLKKQQAEAESLKKQQAEAESLKKQQAEAEALKKQQAEAKALSDTIKLKQLLAAQFPELSNESKQDGPKKAHTVKAKEETRQSATTAKESQEDVKSLLVRTRSSRQPLMTRSYCEVAESVSRFGTFARQPALPQFKEKQGQSFRPKAP